MENKELIKKAYLAQKNAYAPYSNFKVGAAVLTGSGKVYLGCNIENVAFGAGCCAERTAVFSALASGEKQLLKIAVVGKKGQTCYPCGICRQVLIEFNPKMEVICVNSNNKFEVFTAEELLPCSFNNF